MNIQKLDEAYKEFQEILGYRAMQAVKILVEGITNVPQMKSWPIIHKGKRFRGSLGQEYICVAPELNKLVLVSLATGQRYTEPVTYARACFDEPVPLEIARKLFGTVSPENWQAI